MTLTSAAKALWSMVLLRGVLAVLLGLVALLAPGIALLGLIVLFGVYAILDGVTAIVAGVRARAVMPHWGWLVAQGVVSLLAGVVALVWPGATALTILVLIGVWAIVVGVAEIAGGLGARRMGAVDWGWTVAGGVLGVLFGIALLVQPGAGILAFVWLLGAFAVVFGVVVIVWAFRLRSLARQVDAAA
ncbi:HdeD family acid-resistance protein [Pseudonocardia sp. CA-107938]|uniref:HdeD family acid-resistance protein n=1 Tax=Pseudonocardia sp. CA-107938 TaxID=3240021 RepID=UPI003D89D8B9